MDKSKKLVAYFSCTGTTARAASALAAAANAELFEIRPKKPYSPSDLDWTSKKSRSSVEMSDESCRPEIAEKAAGMENYDTVFVGFPIWWYVAPRIVETFLESYDFDGKTVVPFFTSGGSGAGGRIPSCNKYVRPPVGSRANAFPQTCRKPSLKAGWIRLTSENR